MSEDKNDVVKAISPPPDPLRNSHVFLYPCNVSFCFLKCPKIILLSTMVPRGEQVVWMVGFVLQGCWWL